MKFSVGVEYALHCLIYMVEIEEGKSIGIRPLATFQGISETYLSKVFSKLAKAGIVKSTSGVKGGYTLTRDANEITFWDVISAIEGNAPFFRCHEIRDDILVYKDRNMDEFDAGHKSPCLISEVMMEAQNAMVQYLEQKTIYWLYDQVFNQRFTEEERKKTKDWFRNHSW